MPDQRGSENVRRFFSGVTEFVFTTRLGVADPPLIDYVSLLLTRFLHSENIYAVRDAGGSRLTQVADMLEETNRRQGSAKRQLHRHIGDFTLFWTGLYPEMIDRMQRTTSKDRLINYREQGKRSYLIASSLPVEEEQAPSEVLERLGICFELCSYGLQEIRREWEEEEGNGNLPILFD